MDNQGSKRDSASSQSLDIRKEWTLWLILAIPAFLLGIIIFTAAGAGIQLRGIEPDQIGAFIEELLPLLLTVNHILVFGILLYILNKNSLKLSDIGWKIPDSGLGREIITGILFGVLLYLFKEIVYDPIDAYLNGRSPSFTSLFNFHLNRSEVPMIAAAVSIIFIEESVYRGFGIKAMNNRYSIYSTVLVTSIFFGLLHWGNGPEAILYTSVVGLFYAGIFLWRKRNLIAVTVAHGLYNLFILLT